MGGSGRIKVSAPLENAALRDSTMSQLRRPLEAIDMTAARAQHGPISPFDRHHARQPSASSASEALAAMLGSMPPSTGALRRPPMPPSHSAPQLSRAGPSSSSPPPPRAAKRSKEPKQKRSGTVKHRAAEPELLRAPIPRLPDATEMLANAPRLSVASLLGQVDRRIEHEERAAEAAQAEADRLRRPRPAPSPRPAPAVAHGPPRSASLPDVHHAGVHEAAAIKHEVQQLLRSPPTPKRKRTGLARLCGAGRRSEESEREPRSSDDSQQRPPPPSNRLRKTRPRAESDQDRALGPSRPAVVEFYVEPNWVPPTAGAQYPLPSYPHASAEAEDALEVVAEPDQLPEALRDFQWLAKTSLLIEDPSKLNIPGAAPQPARSVRRRSLSAPAPVPLEVRQSVDNRQASSYRYLSPRERAAQSRQAALRAATETKAAPFMSMDNSPPPPRRHEPSRFNQAQNPSERQPQPVSSHVQQPSLSASVLSVPSSTSSGALPRVHPQAGAGRKLVSARTGARGVESVGERVPTWLRAVDGLDEDEEIPTPPSRPFARAPSTPTRGNASVTATDDSPGTDLPASVRASTAGSDDAVDDRALFQLGSNLLRTMSDSSVIDPPMRRRAAQQAPSFTSALASATVLSPASTGTASSAADLDPTMTPELGRFASFDTPSTTATTTSSPPMPPATPPSVALTRSHSGRRVPVPLKLAASTTRNLVTTTPPRPSRSPDRERTAVAASPESVQPSPLEAAKMVLERARTNRRRPKIEAIDTGVRTTAAAAGSEDDDSSLSSELTSADHAHGITAYQPGHGHGHSGDAVYVEELDSRSTSAALTPLSFASCDVHVDLVTATHAHHAVAVAKPRYVHPAPGPSPAPFSQLMPPFEPTASARSRTPPSPNGGRLPLRKPGEAPAMRARLVPPPGGMR